MIVIQEGDNILLKPIKALKRNQFKKIIAIGDRIRNELELKESDVRAIKKEKEVLKQIKPLKLKHKAAWE